MRNLLIFITIFLVFHHDFYGQTLKALYKVEQKKDMLSYDKDTVSDRYIEMVQRLNSQYREILDAVKLKVISSGEVYQVSMFDENPNFLELTQQFNLAKYSLIGWDIIQSDVKTGVAHGILENSEDPIRAVNTKNIVWELTGESKEIGNLKVVQAIAKIQNKEDEYPARLPILCWFAPEIDFHCGPTEYANFEGMIVQIDYPRFRIVLDSYEVGNFPLTPIQLDESKVMDHQEYQNYHERIAKVKYPKSRN